jgi:hypothetical protein
MTAIRAAVEADFEAIWRITQQIVAKGERNVFPTDASRKDAQAYRPSPDFKTFAADSIYGRTYAARIAPAGGASSRRAL